MSTSRPVETLQDLLRAVPTSGLQIFLIPVAEGKEAGGSLLDN